MISLLLTLSCHHQPPASPRAAPASYQRVVQGGPEQRVHPEAADLVLFATGEHAARLGDCDCDQAPRGALGRIASYLRAHRRLHPDTPQHFLYTGHWMADPLDLLEGVNLQVQSANPWMVSALERLQPSAVGLSSHDLPGLSELHSLPSWVTSAHLRSVDEGEDEGWSPWLVVEQAGLRLGVISIAEPAPLLSQPPLLFEAALAGALRACQALQEEQVDFMVLLTHGDEVTPGELASSCPELDLVIFTQSVAELGPSFMRDGVLWVHTQVSSMHLVELRFRQRARSWELVADRRISLDAGLPLASDLEAMREGAERLRP